MKLDPDNIKRFYDKHTIGLSKSTICSTGYCSEPWGNVNSNQILYATVTSL